MNLKNQRLFDIIFLPFYELRLKLKTYIKNQEVKSGFGHKSVFNPIFDYPLVLIVVGGLVFAFILLSFLFKSVQSPEETNGPPDAPPAIESRLEPSKEAIVETVKLPLDAANDLPTVEEPAPAMGEEIEKIILEKITPVVVSEEEKEIIEEVAVVASAPPVEAMPHYMKVLGNNVNIRSESAMTAEVIARLGVGYVVEKLESKEDWVYTDSGEGTKGWIYHNLLEDMTSDESEAWRKNPDRSAIISVIRKELADPNILAAEKKKINKLLRSWESAWEEKNINDFISLYSKAFTKSEFNRESYRAYKKGIFNRSAEILVELKNIEIKWENSFMTASFVQRYRSGAVDSTVMKVIHFQQESEDWKIVKETLVSWNVQAN